MVFFIFTEVMVFASFISAYTIVKSSFTNWPPMGQPRLPIVATAVNSLFLIASGYYLNVAYKKFIREEPLQVVKNKYLVSLVLGGIFFLIQGMEWLKLISYGLSLTSSLYGSFFYLIIGGHALHVLVAMMTMIFLYRSLVQKNLKQEMFAAVRIFWFFVIGVWPVLYVLVYL